MAERLKVDIVVVGGGLVGLGSAYELGLKFPRAKICLLEKEKGLAQHQSGHNSGILHQGMYYVPGSEKARNCRTGVEMMREFAEKNQIPYNICGKTIIATSPEELPRLQNIFERGVKNGVRCHLAGPDELCSREPHVRALQGIVVEETGVIDYPAVAEAMRRRIEAQGNLVRCSAEVKEGKEFPHEVCVITDSIEVTAKACVCAGGLHADRLLKSFGHQSPVTIVPFRGEYYVIKPERDFLCKALIYPVPNPGFPFLGVHLTRGVHGEVECGPNAVLALKREGYSRYSFDPSEAWKLLNFAGLRKFILRHWREAGFEIARSFSKALFAKALQRLVPEIRCSDLIPGPAGVRAQAMLPEGKLVDDFLFFDTRRSVHVLNAPSPAATSSLSIGRTVAARLAQVVENLG